MFAALALVAAAQEPEPAPDCFQSFTEFDVRTLVAQSKDALFRDDLLAHKRIFTEFTDRIPCLQEQLPKDAWAQLLVNEAVARNISGGEWIPLLATVLEVYPEFPEVPEFLLDAYVPPPPTRYLETPPIPEDATLFVDGVLRPKIPAATGQHVLQLWRDGRWTSLFAGGGTDGKEAVQIPDPWLVPKPPKIVEVEVIPEVWVPAGRGVVGAGLGFSIGRQMIEESVEAAPPTEPEYLSDSRVVGGLVSVATFGVQPIAANAGVFWDVLVAFQAPTLRSEAGVEGNQASSSFESGFGLLPSVFAGPAAVLETMHVGVGLGFIRMSKVEGSRDEGVRTWLFYPQPHIAFGVRRGRADFEVAGGLTPAALHGGMRGGWLLSQPRALSWRLGFDTQLGTAWFTEQSPGERQASVLHVGILARFDATWGRDK